MVLGPTDFHSMDKNTMEVSGTWKEDAWNNVGNQMISGPFDFLWYHLVEE